MSIESVMPSNHLILCHPLLLLPSIFPSISVFSNESALHIRWPEYWNVSGYIFKGVPFQTQWKKIVEKVNLLCIPEDKRDAVLEKLKALTVSSVWSSHNCMEITPEKADKGRGLETACRLLHIPVEHTMALGDSGNDIAMLRQAGLGVAMGNAPDFVKAAADVISDRYDEDGAAKAIERWALK